MGRSIKRDEMPLPNRKLYDFVVSETRGNVSEFAKKIGCAQQMIDNLFRFNEKQGKYPAIYPSVKKAMFETYGFDDMWYLVDDEEKEQPKDFGSADVAKLLEIIDNLIKIEERNSKANVVNAEANKMNAQNLEKLLNSIVKQL